MQNENTGLLVQKVIRNFSSVTAECNNKCRALLNAGTASSTWTTILEHSQQPGDYTGFPQGKTERPWADMVFEMYPSNPLPGNLTDLPTYLSTPEPCLPGSPPHRHLAELAFPACQPLIYAYHPLSPSPALLMALAQGTGKNL